MIKPILVLLLALTPTVWAAPETVLYEGKPADQSGLAVAAWGGGSGQESSQVFLFGGHSLKVTTLDFYQGAQITFTSPVLLNSAEPGRVIQITMHRGAPTLHYDPRKVLWAATDTPTTSNTPTTPNTPGGVSAPGGPVAVKPAARPTIPPVTKLRLLFTLADGRHADVLRSIPDTADSSVGDGWYSVSVPLSTLKFPILKLPIDTESGLKSLTLGGDQFGVFYIGRIRVATDTAPITADIEGPVTADPGTPITLRAKADGGLSNLQYTWNFGTGAAQASGAEATATFPNGGQDYTVTLTVSDLDGRKQPAQATKIIHVTDSPQRNNGIPGVMMPGQIMRP